MQLTNKFHPPRLCLLRRSIATRYPMPTIFVSLFPFLFLSLPSFLPPFQRAPFPAAFARDPQMIRFLEESFSSGSGDGLMVTTSSNACLILTRLDGSVDIDFAIRKKKRCIQKYICISRDFFLFASFLLILGLWKLVEEY